MFDDPIGTPWYLRGYSQPGLGAMDALRIQQAENQIHSMQQTLTSLSGMWPSVMPTPTPPDDGQLHISIRKKQIKFNFND